LTGEPPILELSKATLQVQLFLHRAVVSLQT